MSDAGTGAMVLYEMQAIRPMTVTFSFDPVMQRMWPADSPPAPSPEWVKNDDGSGFYILHLAFPDQAAALSLPGGEPGILPPYQEGSSSWPLQFVLHFDPKRDRGKVYPLLMTVANSAAGATKGALQLSVADLASRLARFGRRIAHTTRISGTAVAIETPDADLNAAFSWAEIAIDQLRVQTADARARR